MVLNKDYVWESINIVVKCIVHIHNTAELKAYWLLVCISFL